MKQQNETWLLSVSQKQPGRSDRKKCDDEKLEAKRAEAKWAAARRQAGPEHVHRRLV